MGQHRRLTEDSKRWGVTIMLMPSAGGEQKMVCLPLRKVTAWLCSIQPSRVKPELREKLIAYQTECDQVLWDYWTKGEAKRPGVQAQAKINEAQIRELRTHLLASKPTWNKIVRYLDGGYNYWLIRSLCSSMSQLDFDRMWEAMADCGLVPRSANKTFREDGEVWSARNAR